MAPTNVIEMVLDQTDNPVLRAADLPFHPPQLQCGRCGTPWGRHRPTEFCPEFQRPVLPAGFRYVDELVAGDRFSFRNNRTDDCPRTVLDRGWRDDAQLIWLTSTADRCEPATHWVQKGTIVAVEPDRARARRRASVG